jgi:transmembrane sensor
MTLPPADAGSLEEEALELMLAALAPEAAFEDKQRLTEWRMRNEAHARAYRSAAIIWQSLGVAGTEWIAARSHKRQSVRPPMPGRRVFLGTAMAACGAALVISPPLRLWPSFADLMADYYTKVGERRTVRLSDGLSFEMNTQTRVDRQTAGDRPILEVLAGEAAVSCAAGQSIVVKSARGSTSSQGGVFSIRRDSNGVRVTCVSGSVTVAGDGGKIELHANQTATYGSGKLTDISTVNVPEALAWRDGLLIFRGQTLEEAVQEINRYRPGRIVLLNSDIKKRRITARVELARIDEMVPYLVRVFGAKAQALPAGIVLLS